jgi:hypothetical protein
MQMIAPHINAAILADTLIGEDSSLTGLLGTEDGRGRQGRA